jgi:hypothetical protein
MTENYPDEMFEVAAQREALKDYKEAFAYLNNTEENKFRKILPQKTKDAYNLIAEYCMKEYNEKYGEISEDEYWRYMIADYFATGEGRTLCFLMTQALPRGDDFGEDRYRPITTKEYRSVREFHQKFGGWMLHGATFLSREDFFEKYSIFLPPKLIDLKDKNCYMNYYSELHFNFS